MQIHTYQNRRIIQHDDNHYDIEETRAVLAESGEIVGCEWAVIFCSEDEMTPQRPIELVNASKACAEAWLKRDAMIDAGDKEGVEAMNLTCELLDERYKSMYQQWQILGGTSNIDSLAIPFVDYAEADYLDEQATRADIRAGFQQW